MMVKRLTLLFAGISLCLLAPAKEVEGNQYEQWRESLGSGDFKTRNATMMEVWNEGRGALRFLNDLIKGNDPELAARATTVIRQVKLGVTPETPEKIVQLVEQYFGGTPKMKIVVIEKLLAADEHDILLRLGKLEDDPNVIARIDSIIEKILPEIVRRHLNDGKVELAKEDLALSNQFPHLIHYAHLLDQTGDLDGEIERLSKSQSPEDEARYLACLRVKGEPQELREVASQLGDRDSEIIAALTMGDHVPYIESLLEDSNPSLPNRHYLNWTLANHRGDKDAEKKAFDALVYLSSQESEQKGARASLFRMGYGDLVLKGLEPSELSGKIGYLLSRENFFEAQKTLGIPNEESFSEWLEELVLKTKDEIEKTGTSSELDRLVAATEFLEERGQIDQATQCMMALFDLVRPSGDLESSALARQTYFSAPVSTYTAISRELDEHGASLEEFLQIFQFGVRPDESLWLFDRLLEVYPEMGTRARILLTMSFSSRRLFVKAAQFTEARDRLIELISKEEDSVGSFTKLLVLLEYRNREEDLLKVTGALSDAGSPNFFYEALIAIDAGRFKEAAKLLKQGETDPSFEVPEFLYQKGLVLKRAGIAEGKEMMKRALLLSNGGVLVLQSFAMEHLRYGETREAYELMRKGLLRTENPTKSSQFGIRNAVIEELAVEAVTLGKWENVLAYREVSALYSSSTRVSSGVFIMRHRFQILLARGAVAMEKGDIANAVASFGQAHQMLPRDGYLANDLFPLLRELGLKELHDQLFAKTARDYRELIRLYPKDDNAYNNFAWLASRANRCLDEAEAYLKMALELNPESAAYLDTMGEIYFARQNRPEAVAWSAKCLKNAVLGNRSRWELQYQNQRFKSGGFPPK